MLITEQNIKFSDGVSYDKMMGDWSRIVGLEFLKWLSPGNGQKWLDIGCGTGAFTEQIIENCYPQEVRGVDPSEAQLEFAKNQASRKKAHFQVDDAMKLPFEADEFDVSAMASVIFFIPDPAKGVGEMKRVLRSGGLMAAYTWDIFGGGFPLEPVHSVLRAKGIEYPLSPSAEVSRMVNLESLWKTAGFSSVEVFEINGERKFENFGTSHRVQLR